MMARRVCTRFFVAGVLSWSVLIAGAPAAFAGNKADVRLVPSVSAVTPGEPFEVALEFAVADGWHIYWKNPGDSGMSPKVDWKLPAGFEAGPLRFPVPKRYVDRAALVTNVHDGKPILLATLSAPADLGSARSVRIAADIMWLVCEKRCLQERKSLAVKLPVAQGADRAKTVNEDVFNRARRALPVPGPKGKFVTLTPYLAGGRLAPSSTFHVNLDVQIKRGFHIQSDTPRLPGLIATDVFLDPTEGVFFDRPGFPKPKVKTVPRVGKIEEFEGKITVRIPAETEDELPGDSRVVGGVFVYQACNDKTGTCFPREGVEWSLTIPMGAAGAVGASQTRAEQPGSEAADQPVGQAEGDVPSGDRGGVSISSPREVPPRPMNPAAHGGPGERAQGAALDEGWLGGFLEWLGAWLQRLGLPGLLFGCFLYGLFLNATPCVLPLLSIKVLGFVQQAHESRRRTLVLALAFGTGVVLLFLLLGFLAAAGKNVLHYPAAVIGLATVVMALALSMLGVYTLQVPSAATKLDATIQREGLLSSFGKGTLAPVLGFACTGPLMAGAFGWATQQPPRTAVFAFLFTGLGMASPYMLLGANPSWLRFLPKPGQWMITFERIMGFLLLAMVIWLMSPLVTQIGAEGLEWTLAFLVAVGMACWVLGKIDFSMSAASRWRYRGGATAIVLVVGVMVYGWIYPLGKAIARQQRLLTASPYSHGDWSDGIPWQRWSPEKVEQAVASGKIAFVDFTSAYCTSCKANKALAIDTPKVRARMQALGVVPFQGDFTLGDPGIFAELQKYGVPGVPLDLIYPAGKPDDPIVLGTVLTVDYLLRKLEQAGGSAKVSALPTAFRAGSP